MLFHSSFILFFSVFLLMHCAAGSNNASLESVISFDHYHHQEELESLFFQLALDYPYYARVGSIGKSVENRGLIYIEITDNVNAETPDRPKVKYVGNMHGDETVGRELIIYLSQYLLHNHASDSRSRNILKSMRLFLMPSLNPDGFEASQEGLCQNGYRQNSDNIDLNRNFPDQYFSEYKRKHLDIQPETQAMMNWINANKFILSVNFHAGSEVVVYPYDNSGNNRNVANLTPDNAFFELMARTYANAHSTLHKSEMKCNGDYFTDGITNGADWYAIAGGMMDYNYVYGDCKEIAVELTCCKYPKASTLADEWQKNKYALLETLELVNRGVRGFVTDLYTHAPIKGVIISVENINKTVTTDENGAYWMLLVPGNYTMNVYKPGFADISAVDGIWSLLDIEIDAELYIVRNFTLRGEDYNTEDKPAPTEVYGTSRSSFEAGQPDADFYGEPGWNDMADGWDSNEVRFPPDTDQPGKDDSFDKGGNSYPSVVEDEGGNSYPSVVEDEGGNSYPSVVEDEGGNSYPSVVEDEGGNSYPSNVEDEGHQYIDVGDRPAANFDTGIDTGDRPKTDVDLNRNFDPNYVHSLDYQVVTIPHIFNETENRKESFKPFLVISAVFGVASFICIFVLVQCLRCRRRARNFEKFSSMTERYFDDSPDSLKQDYHDDVSDDEENLL